MAAAARIRVAEFAPDQPSLDGGASGYVLNVTPVTAQSYGPLPSLQEVGGALDARCQGAASFRGPNGTILNVSGSFDKVYSFDGTAQSDISRTVGGAYAVAAEDMWSFAQFGASVIGANGTDVAQLYTIGSSTNFANLTGSPPVGRFAFVVKDFFVLGRIASAQNRVQWPDINSITAWAAGQADSQDLPEGGRIMGCVGGQFGVIFCESAIYRMLYVGTPLVFQFDQISRERGCAAEGSIAAYEDKIFFWNFDGFWMMQSGNPPVSIGDQRVDNFMGNMVNQTYLYRIVSTVDPIRKLYMIAYPSQSSPDGTPDSMLIYNWNVGRWSQASINVEVLYSARANVGYNLDNIDTLIGNLDATGISFDSNLLTGSPKGTLAAFSTSHKLAFFIGSNLAATVDTIEGQINPGYRTLITSTRPLTDGGTLAVSIGYRNRVNDTVNWGAASSQDTFGDCPTFNNAFYQRGRISVASGGTWSHISGLDVDQVVEGDRGG